MSSKPLEGLNATINSAMGGTANERVLIVVNKYAQQWAARVVLIQNERVVARADTLLYRKRNQAEVCGRLLASSMRQGVQP